MAKIEGVNVGRSEESERLYQLEEEITEKICEAAEELRKLCVANGLHSMDDFWKRALPAELATICEGFGYELHKE